MEGIIEAATTKRTGVRVGLALVFLLMICYSYCDVSEFMAQRVSTTDVHSAKRTDGLTNRSVRLSVVQ